MPDQDNQPLPPIEDESFEHGAKEKIELKTAVCPHKNVTLIKEKREIRCACGAAWSGFGIERLYEAMKNQ